MRWLTGRLPPSLWDRPSVSIAEAQDGVRVRVVARVAARGATMRAPVSARECVLWSLALDEMRHGRFLAELSAKRTVDHPGRRARWVERLLDQEVVPFDLEDGTGRAEVDVRGLRGWVDRDLVRREWPLMTSPALRRLLDRYATPDTPLRRHGGPLRAYEGVFRVGEYIAVEGLARWIDVDAAPDALGYRRPGRVRRLVIGPDDEDPVHATNDPSSPY